MWTKGFRDSEGKEGRRGSVGRLRERGRGGRMGGREGEGEGRQEAREVWWDSGRGRAGEGWSEREGGKRLEG